MENFPLFSAASNTDDSGISFFPSANIFASQNLNDRARPSVRCIYDALQLLNAETELSFPLLRMMTMMMLFNDSRHSSVVAFIKFIQCARAYAATRARTRREMCIAESRALLDAMLYRCPPQKHLSTRLYRRTSAAKCIRAHSCRAMQMQHSTCMGSHFGQDNWKEVNTLESHTTFEKCNSMILEINWKDDFFLNCK